MAEARPAVCLTSEWRAQGFLLSAVVPGSLSISPGCRLPFTLALPSIPTAALTPKLRCSEDNQRPSGLQEEPASVWKVPEAFLGALGLGAESFARLCQLRTGASRHGDPQRHTAQPSACFLRLTASLHTLREAKADRWGGSSSGLQGMRSPCLATGTSVLPSSLQIVTFAGSPVLLPVFLPQVKLPCDCEWR